MGGGCIVMVSNYGSMVYCIHVMYSYSPSFFVDALVDPVVQFKHLLLSTGFISWFLEKDSEGCAVLQEEQLILADKKLDILNYSNSSGPAPSLAPDSSQKLQVLVSPFPLTLLIPSGDVPFPA